MLSEIGGFGSIVITIAKCINYFVFRFNMLADTKELISLVLKNNDPVQDNIKRVQSINQLLEENINQKKESSNNLKIYDSKKIIQNIRDIENSGVGREEDNQIINRRINVIKRNSAQETNLKNDENINKRLLRGENQKLLMK